MDLVHVVIVNNPPTFPRPLTRAAVLHALALKPRSRQSRDCRKTVEQQSRQYDCRTTAETGQEQRDWHTCEPVGTSTENESELEYTCSELSDLVSLHL